MVNVESCNVDPLNPPIHYNYTKPLSLPSETLPYTITVLNLIYESPKQENKLAIFFLTKCSFKISAVALVNIY